MESVHRHKMCTRVPSEVWPREAERALIKTRWAETDKGQPGKPNVRARWVAKEFKTHGGARVVRVDAAAGGAQSGAVGDRHG